MPSLIGSLQVLLSSSRRFLYIWSPSLKDAYFAKRAGQPPGEDDKKVNQGSERVDKGSSGGLLGKKGYPNVFANKIKNPSKILIRSRAQKNQDFDQNFSKSRFFKLTFLQTSHDKGTPSSYRVVEKKSENLPIFFWGQGN